MTEISTTAVHLEPSLGSAAVLVSDAPVANGSPPEEDPSQIRCICGFEDDDGNTVLCEDCQTWQHIDCYYPGSTADDVPDIHNCVHCNPRLVDSKAATERQRLSRTIPLSEKKKRAPTKPNLQAKSAKKKLKDPVNGVSHPDAAYAHDRASGSPHDPPPAKKAKTSHRQSASVTNITLPQTGSTRKRTNSVAAAQLSPTKSPPSPLVNGQFDQNLSSEFMNLYDTGYTSTSTNSYRNLSFLEDLSLWLDDPNELSKVTNGKTHNDVFKTWSKPWSDLEDASPGLTKARTEDTGVLIHGRHPVYEYLTVNNFTPSGAFIGELNGEIGRIKDYCADESNRWNSLKHPESFVFFHDKLPICVDSRKEGSILRYIRRSCRPNLSIQIIIVDREYRFCFVSSQGIQENEEATIGWNLTETAQRCAQKLLAGKPFTVDEATNIISWVTGIFSNFGVCACEDRATCNLENLRLRAVHFLGSRPRKKGNKKPNPSPFGTGRATNSRAGSEAVNQADLDEEAVESPSATGSGRSKPSSRDNTPARAGEASVGLGLGGLSSREQRKLEQQERLFEKMEIDGSKGRKRNSAGSAQSTPTVSASASHPAVAARPQTDNCVKKQLGHDSSGPSPTSASGKQPRANGRVEKKPRRSIPNGHATASPPLRPSYSETSTQTIESSPSKLSMADLELIERRKRSGCSFVMKLLRRTKRRRLLLQESPTPNGYSASPSPVSLSPGSENQHDLASKEMPPPPLPVHVPKPEPKIEPKVESKAEPPVEQKVEPVPPPATSIEPFEPRDVDMKDAELPSVTESATPSPNIEQAAFPSSKTSRSQSTDAGTNPPPANLIQEAPATAKPIQPPPRKPTLSVPLPSPSFGRGTLQSPGSTPSTPGAFGATTPSSVLPTTPGLVGGSPTMLQSPTAFQAAQSLISPVMTNAAAPTPVKKKLTLSDYTNRKKKQAATEVQPSPLATSTLLTLVPPDSSKLEADKDAGTSPTLESPALAPEDKENKLPAPDSKSSSEVSPMDVDPKPDAKAVVEESAS